MADSSYLCDKIKTSIATLKNCEISPFGMTSLSTNNTFNSTLLRSKRGGTTTEERKIYKDNLSQTR